MNVQQLANEMTARTGSDPRIVLGNVQSWVMTLDAFGVGQNPVRPATELPNGLVAEIRAEYDRAETAVFGPTH